MPLDPALLESLPAMLRSLSEQFQSISGSPLGDLLLNPQIKIGLVRRIKDLAQELDESAKHEAERDVALAIYFAAIANALLHHNVKISRYTYGKLEQSFETLSRHDWVPSNLGKLFQKAHKYCRKKK
jgi:adenylate kinase